MGDAASLVVTALTYFSPWENVNSQCGSPFPAHFSSVIVMVFPNSSERKPSRNPLNMWQHGRVVLRAMLSKESVIMILPDPFV